MQKRKKISQVYCEKWRVKKKWKGESVKERKERREIGSQAMKKKEDAVEERFC